MKMILSIFLLGSGSEIVSCINNNQKWIASEIKEKNCEIIKERINKNGYEN